MTTLDVDGPAFEDFSRGQEFDAPAVTLTAGHAALYQAWFADRLRLPLDHNAATSALGSAIVHPMLAIHVAIGQSTWASQRVKANLFYRGLSLQKPVYIGDTLHTTTRVVALRQNRRQAGRGSTGLVALEMQTRDQRGALVLHCWRCPMIPCRDDAVDTGWHDDLDGIGVQPAAALDAQLESAQAAWNTVDTAAWRGPRADTLPAGQHWRITARDTVTSAPELVRLTLNMAMAHTDARLSYLGERLVYGGHVISIAHAQMTRALPNLVAMLAWESCEHTAPTLENDRIRTECTLLENRKAVRGSLLKLRVESFAARGSPDTEIKVLDWSFWALSA
jgi:2-methylfumaryl-CoA hydratase